jgi:hypothetical protein
LAARLSEAEGHGRSRTEFHARPRCKYLIRVVNAVVNEGITSLAVVLDSFDCLASQATAFRQIIRRDLPAGRSFGKCKIRGLSCGGEASAVMRLLAPIAFAVLCGCATQVGEAYWVRTDGGLLNGKHFEADRTACIAEVQKSGGTTAAAGEAFRDCMTRRGYLQQLPQ